MLEGSSSDASWLTSAAPSPELPGGLRWANASLIADRRGHSEARQGATCEVRGEGRLDGPPLTAAIG